MRMEAAASQFRVAEFRGNGEFRERVAEAWRLLRDWYRDAGMVEERALPIADMAFAAMSVFSGLSPEKVAILDTAERGWVSEAFARVARDKKRELIESLPDLVAFYTERDRRAAEADKVAQQLAQRRQAEFDAGAPARLLAKLRAGGAQLGLEGGKVTLAVGTPISMEDHALVKEALVAVLRAEAEAARPMVLA